MPSTLGIVSSHINYIPPTSVQYIANEKATLRATYLPDERIRISSQRQCFETWVYPTGPQTTLFSVVDTTNGIHALRVRYFEGFTFTSVGSRTLSGNILVDSNTSSSTGGNTTYNLYSPAYTPLNTWIKVKVVNILSPKYSGTGVLTTLGQRSLYVNDLLVGTTPFGTTSDTSNFKLEIHSTGPICGYADFKYSLYDGTNCGTPLFRTHIGAESTNSGSNPGLYLAPQTANTIKKVYIPLPY